MVTLLLRILSIALFLAPSAGAQGAAPDLVADELTTLFTQMREARRAGDSDGARERLSWILELVEAEPESATSPRIVETIVDVGATADDMRESGLALRAFEWLCRALPTTQVPGITLAEARFGRASALIGTGRLTEARDELRALVPLFDEPGDALRVRENLAIALKELGELNAALDIQIEIRDLSAGGSDPQRRARAHINLAGTLEQMRRLSEARRELELGMALLPADHPDLWSAQRNLAAVLVQLGAFRQARPLAESALETLAAELGEGHPLTLDARISLAGVLRESGDLEGARELLERTLHERRRELRDDSLIVARERENLAVLMNEMGDFEASRAAHERVLEAYAGQLPEDHPDVVMACLNLSNTLLEMGEPEGAARLQRAVLEVRAKSLPRDHPELLFSKLHLGRTLRTLKELEEASRLLHEVHVQWKETLRPDHPWTARAQHDLAWTQRLSGDLERARENGEQALAYLRELLPADSLEVVEATEELAWTLVALEDTEALAELVPRYAACLLARLNAALTRSPHEARKQADWDLDRQSTLIYLDDLLEGRFDDEVFRVLELHRQVTSAPLENSDGVDELRQGALELRGRINDLIASGDFDRNQLADLVGERNRVERQIRRQASASVVAVDAAGLGRALPERSAAIGFRRYTRSVVDVLARGQRSDREHLLAHVVRSNGELLRLDLGPMVDLDTLIERWRRHHKKPLTRAAFGKVMEVVEEDPGVPLRRRLLDPVLAALGEDVDTLFICLDDALHLVPLDALPLEDKALGARYPMRFLVSFASLIAPRPALDNAPTLVALGGPSFNTRPTESPEPEDAVAPDAVGTRGAASSPSPTGLDFPPLRQTRFEVENLVELHDEVFGEGAELFTKTAASKQALQGAAPGARYLHLATHGYFAPETLASTAEFDEARLGLEVVRGLAPMSLCGLALTGANLGRDGLGRVPGILTAEELAGMDLAACELAVLSACETNVGIVRAGQGVRSLQAALHAAGARASITSLWRVDDEWTRVLMEDFYTRLWVRGQDKAEALWASKMALVARGAEPQHWAAWVLVE